MGNYSRKVKIEGKSSAQLYEVLSSDIDRLMSKISVGKYEVNPRPEESQVLVKGVGFTATLSCEDEQLAVDAQLGFLLLPLKSKLDEAITRWLNKTFDLKLVS